MRAAVLVGALSLIVSLLGPMSASSADPSWTPAEALGVQASDLEIDVNSAGDAVAVWTSDNGVKASYRPARRNWEHPVEVGAAGGDLVGAFLDDRGRATAVWWDDDQLMVADRDGDNRWRRDEGAPGAVGTCCWAGKPSVEGDAEGNLVVTWTEFDDLVGASHILWWRTEDGRWINGGSGGGSYFYGIAVHDGVATLAKGGDGVYTQTSRVRERATAWKVMWPGVNVGAPMLATNTKGDLVLAAVDGHDDPDGVMNVGDPGRLLVLTKPVGQRWRKAFLHEPSGPVTYPSVGISESGRIGVTYQRALDSALEVRLGDVEGGAAGDPRVLSTAPHDGPVPVVFNPEGDAVVVWSTGDDTARLVYAAHRPVGGSWSAPASIGLQDQGIPTVTAYPNGMFTAFLLNGAAKWSDYVDDTVGPRTWLRRPSRRYTTNVKVPVRWDATDDLSRPSISDVRVRVGDRTGSFTKWWMWRKGTRLTSSAFSGEPGMTYCFKARSYDRVGNIGAWSPPRCATTPLDDRAFTGTARWNRVKQRDSYMGTLTTTKRSGQRLRLSGVRGTSLRLLVRTCPNCGTVQVTHAGHDLGVFELTSPRARNRVIVLGRYPDVRSGAVVIKVRGGGKRVQIDGAVGLL